MTIDDFITDESLQPLLKTSQAVLAQSQSMIDWLQEHGDTATPSLELQLELAQQQKIMHAYLTKLRGLHRRAMFSARDTKQVTAEARQEVDRLLLQLQNLYYEQRHLMGEIGAFTRICDFRSSLDEYVTIFPEQAMLSEEELMPLRIEYEKQERSKMEEQRLKLVKIKEGLTKENSRKKDELKKVDDKLEAMIDGLKPLEEALGKEV